MNWKKHTGEQEDAHVQKAKKPKKSLGIQVLNISVFVLCALLLVTLLLSHTSLGAPLRAKFSHSSEGVSALTLAGEPIGSTLSTEEAASHILPAVVGIVQYQKGSIGESGEGSGILMSADGRIITNNHVVEGAGRLDVVLRNGKHYAAKVVGTDVRTDLAVVKIDAHNLSYAKFGDSKQCAVGEQVIAVGNPSGMELAGSVTQGIISALNRNIDVGNGPMNLIQTDAAINPGNSGGALVNMYGQVVGINSAKIAQTGYEGLGFSIPISTAKPIVDSILQHGYVKGRVKFGLKCREVDVATAEVNHIPRGLYVGYVEKGSSAEQNGVKADDIITKLDSKSIQTADALITERDRHKPGDQLQLTLYRRSEQRTLQVPVTLLEDKGAVDTQGDW